VSTSAQVFVHCTLFVRDGMLVCSYEKTSSFCFADTRWLTAGAAEFVHNMWFTQWWYFVFVAGVETQFRSFLAYFNLIIGICVAFTELILLWRNLEKQSLNNLLIKD